MRSGHGEAGNTARGKKNGYCINRKFLCNKVIEWFVFRSRIPKHINNRTDGHDKHTQVHYA